MPDWLLNNEGKAPSRNEVEAELQDDCEEEDLLRNQLLAIFKQKNYLLASKLEKTKKTDEWFSKTLRQVVSGAKEYNLSTYLIFNSTFPPTGPNSEILSDNIDVIPDAELYSLWVEDLFKEAGIISGKELTEDGLNNLKLSILAQNEENSEAKPKFESIRYTNKDCYNILRHNLGRITRLLPEDRVELLKEFIDTCELSDSNKLITFVADLLAETVGNLRQTQSINEDIRKSLDSCKKFVRKFVANHSSWLYGELKNKLYLDGRGSVLVVESNTLSETDMLEPISELESKPEPVLLIQEFEQELTAVDRSKLADWQVICALDTSMSEHSFLEIPGITSDEKSKFLQHAFASKGMSCSVKFTSIINALEWKTESPQSRENLVPTVLINGISWKKMKRQAVRIHYRMSSEEKRIVFNVLPRKDWLYFL